MTPEEPQMAAEERRNGNDNVNSFTTDDTDLERRNDTDQLQLRKTL